LVKPVLIPSICAIVESGCHTGGKDILRKVVIHELRCCVVHQSYSTDTRYQQYCSGVIVLAPTLSPSTITDGELVGLLCDLDGPLLIVDHIKNAKSGKPTAN
jgi:hypothetical protein